MTRGARGSLGSLGSLGSRGAEVFWVAEAPRCGVVGEACCVASPTRGLGSPRNAPTGVPKGNTLPKFLELPGAFLCA